MSAQAVDLNVELLSGGLGKLTSKCSINGRQQANPEGVALVVRVVTSLFTRPPCVATHISGSGVAAELPESGIAGGSADPMEVDASDADGAEGQGEDAAVSEAGSEESEAFCLKIRIKST